jgi:hypothetical protein
MNIVQKTSLQVEKDGKIIELMVPADMPLGLLFDALMELKGYVVTRMTVSHESEAEEAAKMMGDSEEETTEQPQE